MTVTNQNYKNNYIANGTNTNFTYSFKIFKNTDIAVYVDDVIVSSGYSVTNAGNDLGGEVIFSTAPIANSRITLLRNVLFTQEINPGFGDNSPSEQIEEGLDRGVFMGQYLLELVNRCLQLSPSSTAQINIPTAEANKAIGWNDTATQLINLAVQGGTLLGNQDILGWLRTTSYIEALGGVETNTVSESTSGSGISFNHLLRALAGVAITGNVTHANKTVRSFIRAHCAVASNGTIIAQKGITSVTKTGTGVYRIVISESAVDPYFTQANAGEFGANTTNINNTTTDVRTYNNASTPVLTDLPFYFEVSY